MSNTPNTSGSSTPTSNKKYAIQPFPVKRSGFGKSKRSLATQSGDVHSRALGTSLMPKNLTVRGNFTLQPITVHQGGTYIAQYHQAQEAPAPEVKRDRPALYKCIINPAVAWLIIVGAVLRLNYYDDHQFIKIGLSYLIDQQMLAPFVKVGGIGMDTEGLGDFVAWAVLWLMVTTCAYSSLKNFVFGISSYLFVGKTK